MLGDKAPRRPYPCYAAPRVYRGERDQHVGVPRGGVGDLFVGKGRVAGGELSVDRENHGSHRPRPVLLSEVGDGGGRQRASLEVSLRGLPDLLVGTQVPVVVLLDVNVNVDGGEGVKVQHGLCPPGRKTQQFYSDLKYVVY